MSMAVKILISVGVLFALVGLWFVSTFISVNNQAVRHEAGLMAALENDKNVHAAAVMKIREVAQVPAMYADDLVRVVTAANEGRYGEDGSGAVFQWLKEHNPNVDSSVSLQVQRVIEASRNDFKMSQQARLDRWAVYDEFLKSVPQVLFARMLGFPKVDMAMLGRAVSTEDTQRAFDTGMDAPMALR